MSCFWVVAVGTGAGAGIDTHHDGAMAANAMTSWLIITLAGVLLVDLSGLGQRCRELWKPLGQLKIRSRHIA